MNEEQLFKILKGFRSIKPNDEYLKRSRPLILSAPRIPRQSLFRINILDSLKFAAAIGLASLLIFMIFNGLSEAPSSISSSFSSQKLAIEAENLNFQIQLSEAKYFTESASKIADLLKEISQN